MNGIRVGNAPCSWGSLEFEGLQGQAIGYSQMLDELAATGYQGTELGDWGYMPTEPALLHAELARRHVELVGAFVPVALRDAAAHAPGQAKCLQVARLLAGVHRRSAPETAPFLVLADDNGTDPVRTRHAGRVTPELGLPPTEWEMFAAGANRIAAAVRDQTGLRTVFHHHCAGFVETPDEIARLLALTDPGLLGLVFDTGHLTFGASRCDAVSAVEALNRFGDRIWYLHFKDCQPGVARQAQTAGWDYFTAVRHGVFCELGRGCVDFPAIVGWLQRRDYRGWVLVEQDVLPGLGTPRDSAQRNREFLRSIGL
jgi:inosose dehydratase